MSIYPLKGKCAKLLKFERVICSNFQKMHLHPWSPLLLPWSLRRKVASYNDHIVLHQPKNTHHPQLLLLAEYCVLHIIFFLLLKRLQSFFLSYPPIVKREGTKKKCVFPSQSYSSWSCFVMQYNFIHTYKHYIMLNFLLSGAISSSLSSSAFMHQWALDMGWCTF